MTDALREKFEACYPPPQYAVTANGLEVAKAIYYGQREYRDRWEGFQKGWQAASEINSPQAEMNRLRRLLRTLSERTCYCCCHSDSSSRPACVHCRPENWKDKPDPYCLVSASDITCALAEGIQKKKD